MFRFLAIMAVLAVTLTGCPMQISTIEELQKIGNDPAYPLDGDYVLMNDIDASATATWNGGAGFAPIGPDNTTPFTGTLDGQGFGIDGLAINRPTEYVVALFGCNKGRISNLYVTGSVLGDEQVSMLVGILYDGVVEKCGVAGLVEGNSQVGGAVGLMFWGGGEAVPEARDSYADVSVTGHGPNVGGFVGLGAMYCYNSWSAGSVVNDAGYEYFTGGFAGYLSPANSCYYDATTSGQADNIGKGMPRTTAAMMLQETFEDWDFTDTWGIDPSINDGYPHLLWQVTPPETLTASSLASAYYDQYVTLYRQGSLDAENMPIYIQYYLPCRLDKRTVRINDADGLQVICSTVMICDTKINPVTDYIVTDALEKLVPAQVIQQKDFSSDHYEVYLR